jgi:hypothetical protein
MVISCDRCNARLDLGPVNVRRMDPSPRRTPSGWLSTGGNRHLCTLCAQGSATSSFIRAIR